MTVQIPDPIKVHTMSLPAPFSEYTLLFHFSIRRKMAHEVQHSSIIFRRMIQIYFFLVSMGEFCSPSHFFKPARPSACPHCPESVVRGPSLSSRSSQDDPTAEGA